jgi:UDP-N-acetylmuramoyl-tripeptide--D-alanyl-D-alanine ligase
MKGLTLDRIAQVCGGTYHGNEEDRMKEVSAITTDSRQAEPGGLFAAICGERVDGHDFIPAVLEKGALCVITERTPGETDGNYIQVASTLDALKAIAEEYLKQLQIPVVGITGSVGKTSTKEMVAAVLAQKYRVLKTAGNFNNELGLPLTVFRLRDEDEIAVLEMGISNFGEMHRLAKIARPDTCVITNIGQCHLEFLGDRDGILRAKTEIFDFLRPDGHIILNGDDDKLRTVTEVKGIVPQYFGIDSPCEVYADQIEKKGLDGVACTIHTPQGSFRVQIPVPGIHMVRNALAGTAVGLQYGLTLEEIRAGIESLQPVSGRFHILHEGGYVIVDDCYNANPVSMKASLEVLQDGLGRKVAILGDMGELGSDEAALHCGVGEFAAGLDLDCCIVTGPLMEHFVRGAHSVRPELLVVHLDNLDQLLGQLEQLVQPGDTILVKASHYMHFEKVVERLRTMGQTGKGK